MANSTSRGLNYRISLTTDAGQVYQELQKVQKQLNDISLGKINLGTNTTVSELNQAADAASRLSVQLKNALNTETGKLDLSKFQASLASSEMTLEKYRQQLMLVGADGQKVFMDFAKVIAQSELPLIRTNKLMDSLWVTMKNTVRWQVTTSALRTFTGGIQTAYRYAEDLNESLNSIRIVTQKSAEDMKEFAKQANDAAKSLSTTTTNYTDASLIYYQQGLSDEQVQGRTDTTIKLANVAGESAETASEQLTAIWNNFYNGSKTLEYYADVMVALGASTASSSDEIAAGIQKFAAVAGTVGLSYEYAAAALATLTANTREAPEVIGNSLKTLFARLQGLSLGETLEDGTDLNKYSKALQAVGVDILDINDNLKSMDTLLVETAQKWDGLTGAQKTALAQTVAGVRQYNQFVALMDNWGDFEKNLQTAYSSTGTLEEQAEIFAESWEAARKRVKASAEDVYDSLINEDFFIGFDNGLSVILDRIAEVIDAMGGFKGVLSTVGALLTSVYGNKIAESIRNMAYNVSILSGAERQRAIDLKSEALASMYGTAADKGDPILFRIQELYKNQIAAQIEANELTRNFSEYQKAQIVNEEKLLALITERGVQYGELAAKQRDANEELQRALVEQGRQSYNVQTFSANVGRYNLQQGSGYAPGREILDIARREINADTTMLDQSHVSSLVARLSGLKTELTQVSILTKEWNEANEQVVQGITGARNRVINLQDQLNKLGIEFEVVGEKTKISEDSLARLDQRYTALRTVLIDFYGLPEKQINEFVNSISQSVVTEERQIQTLEQAGNAAQAYGNKIRAVAAQQQDWAATLVSVGSALFQLSMITNAAQNIGRIFTDEDMSNVERFTALMTSLGMILPIISRSMIGLKAAINGTSTSFIANTAVLVANKVAGLAVGTVTLAMGKGFTAASVAANGLTLSLGGVLGVLGAIVGITALFIWGIDKLVVTEKEAQEAIEKTNTAFKEQTEAVQSLEDELKTANDRLEELLSKDTLEVVEQEELIKLKQEVALLEQQLEIEKEIQRARALENKESINKNLNKSAQTLLEGPDYAKNNQVVHFSNFRYDENGMYDRNSPYLWYEERMAELEESYKDREKDKYYEEDKQHYLEVRNEWLKADKEIQAEFLDSNKDTLSKLEDEYTQVLSAIDLGGVYSDEEAEEIKSKFIDTLTTARKNMLGEDYGRIIIHPILEQSDITNLHKRLADGLDISNFISDELKKTLEIAGISVDDFIDYIQQRVDLARQNIAQYTNNPAFFDNLTDEQIQIVASMNLEGIDTFEEFYRKLLELQSEKHDILVDVQVAKDAAEEALKTLASGEFIDEEVIEDLKAKFKGIYDLNNLGVLSMYDQAKTLSEAYYTTMNPELITANFTEDIDKKKEKIGELQDQIENLNKVVDSFEFVPKTDNVTGTIKNLQDEIANLTDEKVQLELDTEYAEKQLSELNEFKLDPIEVEIDSGYIDSVLAQMGAIKKAADLIGEGFIIEAENVETMMRTMPQLFEDAIVDANTGVVQLSQSIVESVAQTAQDEVNIRADAMMKILEARIAESQGEIDILNELKRIAISSSNETLLNDIKNSNLTQEQYGIAVKAIIKAKIQQAIQERTASSQTASQAVQDQNKVTDASAQEGKAVAGNWQKVAENVNKNLYQAFSAAATYQKQLAAGATNIQPLYIKGVTAVGFSSGTSEISWAHSNEVTDEYNELRKYLDNDFKILGEDRAKYGASMEDLIQEQLASLGYDIDVSDITIGGESFLDAFTNTYEGNLQKFIDDADTALSDTFYELGVDINDYSRLIEGIKGRANDLVTSGLKDQKKTKEDKGPKEGKIYDEEDAKTLEEIEDRYHEITREILRQSDLLDDISNDLDRAYGIDKIRKYKKEQEALNKQLTNYNSKLKEATERYLPQDTQKLRDLFGAQAIDSRIKANGELADYEGLLQQVIDEHKKFEDDYNQNFVAQLNAMAADKEAQEAWLASIREDGLTQEEYWKQRKEAADQDYEDRLAALKQYEDTRDTIQEIRDNIEDTMRAIADNRLSQIEYRLEIVLDVKSMKDAIREFDKKVAEIFNDALTHGLDVAKLSKEQAEVEAAMYPEYADQYRRLVAEYESADNYVDRDRIMKDIQDLQGKVLDSAEAIVEWVNSIEDIIPDAVDAAATRFKLFTDQLEHNTTILDTIKELYALQGVTYKTMDGFNRLQKVSQEKLEAQVAESKLQKAWYEEAAIKLQEAQAALDSLNGNETDLRYDTYKKARDAYLQEFNEAQEAYLSLAQQAMETAQQMYLEQIERAVYKFGQAVSGGIGLDLLQDKYDHYIEKDDRYFDKVNEAYQVTAWYNKLQADIDAATNQKTKDRLKALQAEIDIRREGNKLSQYDLDILNAKYEVLKAQMALEDAQNAKNNYQLVRDRQGNWNYQFTANPEDVENAEQDLIDAEIDWYNIAKQQVTDVTGEIIKTWQECQDKIKEIYSDMTLTDQERSDRAAEIYAYYTDKIKYLEEEKQVAINDMTEAGNASLFANAVLMGDKITDLTTLTSDDIKRIAQEGGESMIGLLTKDGETIKNIIAGNAQLIDIFDNVYAKDLDNMTKNTDKFEEELQKTLGEAEDDFRKYKDTVSDVADQTGTSLDDLDQETNKVSDSTDRLQEAGLQAADALWDMIGAAQDLAFAYADMAQEIWGAVEALRALAEEQANYVASKADLENKDDWDVGHYYVEDYSAELNRLHNQGKDIFSDEYRWLWDERAQKYEQQGWADKGAISNAQLDDLFKRANNGDLEAQRKLLDVLNGKGYFTVGFDTGGYTGDFSDAKLAFLHEKELVLNQDDTKNILTAVSTVRSLGDNLFSQLEKAIDGNVLSVLSLIGNRISAPADITPGILEQEITINEVVFPGVTDRNEIKEAFSNLANEASQYIRRRRD